eukprot:CAMPEP_0202831174 /NCGR_PEP_ID=MMETSP1389-20130828/16661_1 /ASSEMBLY_ACC=CAM_ASM_000865 /TAXON_ID=302021 /ORGANISM="Rhodomonas sp., Strain CCMP768" /LENGTH=73 /DNA_ID=CAMNT_0049504877 /DNA_START=62 /DNA_END=280 /DNA_ORIENTATION=-
MNFVAFEEQSLCLDGSPGGYYIRAGLEEVNNWVLYLDGAGWCFSEAECLARAETPSGSSANWPKRISDVGGIL